MSQDNKEEAILKVALSFLFPVDPDYQMLDHRNFCLCLILDPRVGRNPEEWVSAHFQ